MKPDLRRIRFIKEEKSGHSKKFRIRDAAGREWVAKVGREAQSETAAVRLVWAVGYESEINYLVPRLTIPGQGTFENVRLEEDGGMEVGWEPLHRQTRASGSQGYDVIAGKLGHQRLQQ